MDLGLAGRVAVVTGSSQGIGGAGRDRLPVLGRQHRDHRRDRQSRRRGNMRRFFDAMHCGWELASLFGLGIRCDGSDE